MATNPPLTRWGQIFRKINPEGVVTTNWDTLLEKVIPGARKCTWPDDIEILLDCLRAHSKFILHLHGDVDSGNIVVTSRDCKIAESTLSRRKPLLADLMSFHVMLVIGYGFPDRHILNAFNRAINRAGKSFRTVYVLDKIDSERKTPKGAKVIRYPDHDTFPQFLNQLASDLDPAPALYQLSEPRTTDELYGIISAQRYDWKTLDTACRRLSQSPQRVGALESIAGLLMDNPQGPHSGILATILSKMPEFWDPAPGVSRSLAQWAAGAIRDGNTDQVGVIEPLSAALFLKGEPGPHRDYLRAAIDSQSWRNADSERVHDYYDCHINVQVDAIERHMADQRRTGALHANDVTRLLTLLESDSRLSHLVPPLNDAIHALRLSGDRQSAEKVQADLEALKRRWM
ncbi:SIR2 family protein [Streptomyces sp. NPDC029721]|uniref:SIR2 family protein n=1 Tax=Streptomyces sp. NPDC029721 TaxID=3157090 RepID=UPI0033D2815B